MATLRIQVAFAAALAVLCSLLKQCEAGVVVDVFRLVQYDLHGEALGSRKTYVNHYASAGLELFGGDASRVVLILPVRDLDLPGLQEYVQKQRDLGGLLLLLPEKVEEEELKVALELERWLISHQFRFPVYFTREDHRVDTVLRTVKAGEAVGRPATAALGGYKLVVSVPEAKKLPAASLGSIQGWLRGQRIEGEDAVLPTIAVVAHYDTFGAAPALAAGANDNGSGVAALLEVVRLYSQLYSSVKTRGRYNLLFALTSGGPYNFAGTAKWLSGLDQRLKESIDFALCLDGLGTPGQKFFWHVSKPLNNLEMQQMYGHVASVGANAGADMEVNHRKINISSSRVAWEHEQFSRNRIMAATFSKKKSSSELLQRPYGIFDGRDRVDDASVVLSVKVVAESLARHIYGWRGGEIFADGSSMAVNPAYVRAWLDFLAETPRVAPYLSKNSSIVSALYTELSERTTDVTVSWADLDESFAFYDSVRAELSIQEVAGVTFDILVMLAVAAYLGALFLILLGVTKGLDDIFDILRKPSSKKLKSI